MNVVVAVDAPDGARLAAGLEREGIAVTAVVAAAAVSLTAEDRMPGDEADAVVRALAAAEAVVIAASRAAITAAAVALCDRAGVRILPWGDAPEQRRLCDTFGVEPPVSDQTSPWRIAEVLSVAPAPVEPREETTSAPRTITVWGAGGAPGRTTVAIELAAELARGGRHVGLVDADTHGASIALALGLADEGPGFAAACRQAQLGGLDARELARISQPLGRSGVDVLAGLNRPSRWPELSAGRVTTALAACRDWADYTVVDVASSLERDEEIVSDLEGPRRNAATLAALDASDLVVAVVGADPVGVSRFLRAHPDLRAAAGGARIAVLANRLRPGPLGVDARGQVRRTLERFAGIDEVWFVPADARAADAALLAARPIADAAPRSGLTTAIRRFVGEAVVPPPSAAARRSRRARGDRTAA
ncbi:P-loop NTPase [Microbacter sp. GSS18]|nr:P-loop NTPase [Microbacter sp. GSS18]